MLYEVPAQLRKYKPDFFVEREDGTLVIIETKGLWTAEDRKKMSLVIEQNPRLDIRMLFERDRVINKNSHTKYTDWCNKRGIVCAVGRAVPHSWLEVV